MPSRSGVRRALAGLAIAVGLASVAGCSTEGDLTFHTDAVTVDLRLRHPQGQNEGCDTAEPVPGLTVQDRTIVSGQVSCTIAGTVLLDDESDARTGLRALMSFSGGHQFLVLPKGVMGATMTST